MTVKVATAATLRYLHLHYDYAISFPQSFAVKSNIQKKEDTADITVRYS